MDKNYKDYIVHIKDAAIAHAPAAGTTKTHFSLIDDSFNGGFRPGDLVIIAGYSGQGKTTLAQAISMNMARNKEGSLWFSYEVNDAHLYKKFILMGLDPKDPYASAIWLPSQIQDVTMTDLENYIIAAKQVDKSIKAVFIDHLYFLTDWTKSENLSGSIGGVMRKLKLIAVKQDIIIFLNAHLNRPAGQARNMPPSLHSLFGSSFIGNEADAVIYIERAPNAKQGASDIERLRNQEAIETYSNMVKISIMKNRAEGKLCFGAYEFNNGRFENVKPKVTIVGRKE